MTNRSFPDRLKTFRPISASLFQALGLVGVASLVLGLLASPALAHHPLGGRLPSNFFEFF